MKNGYKPRETKAVAMFRCEVVTGTLPEHAGTDVVPVRSGMFQ